MKLLFIRFLVLAACLAFGTSLWAGPAEDHLSICVQLEDKTEAQKPQFVYLDPKEGYFVGWVGGGSVFVCESGAATPDPKLKGPNGVSHDLPSCSYDISCIANHSAQGRWIVRVAYESGEENKPNKKVDRTLPVWDKKPDAAKWCRLDHRFTAVAYLTVKPARF